MTPQENQPGEATPQNLDGSEPQVECHTPPNVTDGVKVWTGYEIAAQVKLHGWKIEPMVPASDYGDLRLQCSGMEIEIGHLKDTIGDFQLTLRVTNDRNNALVGKLSAERAKRMEAERERDDLAEGWAESNRSHLDVIALQRAELLALRGGKVGVEPRGERGVTWDQNDLGGTEPAFDFGLSIEGLLYLAETYQEYVTLLGEELSELMPLATAHGWKSNRYEAGKTLRDKLAKLTLALSPMDPRLRAILGPHAGGTAANSVQSESGAPSPEPAAIPKTTSAREWWIDTRPNVFAHDIAFPYECRHTEGTNDFVHVREVGEGRKVSREAMQQMIDLVGECESFVERNSDWPSAQATMRIRAERYRELLCVLSEEGGRQKEGGTAIQSELESPPKS